MPMQLSFFIETRKAHRAKIVVKDKHEPKQTKQNLTHAAEPILIPNFQLISKVAPNRQLYFHIICFACVGSPSSRSLVIDVFSTSGNWTSIEVEDISSSTRETSSVLRTEGCKTFLPR